MAVRRSLIVLIAVVVALLGSSISCTRSKLSRCLRSAQPRSPSSSCSWPRGSSGPWDGWPPEAAAERLGPHDGGVVSRQMSKWQPEERVVVWARWPEYGPRYAPSMADDDPRAFQRCSRARTTGATTIGVVANPRSAIAETCAVAAIAIATRGTSRPSRVPDAEVWRARHHRRISCYRPTSASSKCGAIAATASTRCGAWSRCRSCPELRPDVVRRHDTGARDRRAFSRNDIAIRTDHFEDSRESSPRAGGPRE